MVSHQNGESLSVESGGRWLFHPRKPSWTFGATVDRNAITVTTTREIARHILKDRSKEAFLGGRGNQGVRVLSFVPGVLLTSSECANAARPGTFAPVPKARAGGLR